MGRAIALVHIQVNHRNFHLLAFVPPGLGLHQPSGDRNVVEHTKPAALVRIGMVRAARQVARHALPQGIASSRHGGAHRAAGPLGHGGTPRKADFPLQGGLQSPGAHPLDVGGRVHQRQLAITGGWGLLHLDDGQLLCEAVTQPAVLAHRKPVALGQRQDKVVGVVSVHGQFRWGLDSRKPSLI